MKVLNIEKIIKKILYLTFPMILFYSVGIAENLTDGADSAFYPDLRLTENIFVAGNKAILDETIVVRSVAALERENGKCAIPLEYEIYNTGAVPVSQRFFSGIEIDEKMGSSRLINGIGSDEKIRVNSLMWLTPGEQVNVRIIVDNLNSVKEVSEDDNSRELSVLLIGTCEETEAAVPDGKSGVDGLFKKFDYRIQDHELYK